MRAKVVLALTLAFLFCFASLAYAQQAFPTTDGRNVVVDTQKHEELARVLRLRSEPSPQLLASLFYSWSPALMGQLRTLATQDAVLAENQADAGTFIRQRNLGALDYAKLRFDFIDESAKYVIRYLRENRSSLAILLARDMDEIYRRAEFLLSTHDDSLKLDEATKAQIYSRLRLRTASRELVRTITSVDAVWPIFGFTPEDLRDRYSEITFFDTGYEGTIPRMLAPMLHNVPGGEKIRWRLLWRARTAPDYVQGWSREFYAGLTARIGNAASEIIGDSGPNSFRILALEHQPKWTGRAVGVQPRPVHVFLDVDDTILKEVSIAEFSEHPEAQAITYKPSPDVTKRYQERLRAGGGDGKVIHYRFNDDGTMTSFVTVRPAMVEFFREIEPLIAAGRVKIFLASANDYERTQEVLRQVRIGGRPLADFVETAVDPARFKAPDGQKNIPELKKNFDIVPHEPVLVVDDLPKKITASPVDQVAAITAYGREASEAVLRGSAEGKVFQLADLHEARQLAQLLYQMGYREEANPESRRLRALAQRVFLYEAEMHGKPGAGPRSLTACNFALLGGKP